MFTTFIIVFLTTFFIVFIIRIAIRKFSDVNDQPARRRTPENTEPASFPSRVFTIERTSSTIVSSHRAPPPDYNQSIHDEVRFPRVASKQIIIISDKELPSYEEVVAQKQLESTVINIIPTASNSTETTAAAHSTTTHITTISNRNNTSEQNSITNSGIQNNEIENRTNNNVTAVASVSIAPTTVNTQLHTSSQ